MCAKADSSARPLPASQSASWLAGDFSLGKELWLLWEEDAGKMNKGGEKNGASVYSTVNHQSVSEHFCHTTQHNQKRVTVL